MPGLFNDDERQKLYDSLMMKYGMEQAPVREPAVIDEEAGIQSQIDAKTAADLEALSEAEDMSRQSRLAANIGRGIDTMSSAISGRNPSESFYKDAIQQSQLPFEVSDRRQKIKDANAKLLEDYLNKKYLRESRAREERFREERAQKTDEYRADSLKLASQKAEKEAMQENAPKQLPAAQIGNLKEGETIPATLKGVDELLSAKGNLFGPIMGRLASKNPYDTEAQSARAKLKTASQQVGRFLEGGVLRKEDEAKYEMMLPQLSDTPDVAKAKLEQVYDLVSRKQQELIKAVKEQKYSTAGFQEDFPKLSGSNRKPDAGKIKVSNGSETLLIDESDLKEAEADGYKRVQ